VQPAKLQSLLQNAITHHRAGRLAEAETLYRQARMAAPRNFDVLHLSGLVAYQQGRMNDAVDLLGRAHKLDRKSPVCEMRYALALLAAKRPEEAERHLRHAVEVKPDFHEGWDNLAYCLKTQDRLAEAITCHQKSVDLKPDYACGWYNYGLTLSLFGEEGKALIAHDHAIAADPAYAIAYFGRAQALHQAHRIPEAVAAYDKYLSLQPDAHDARSYRLFALHSLEDISREELFAQHVAYGRTVAAPSGPSLSNSPDPARRLRIAVLSPDLRAHSCAYFLEPLLQHLDRAQFEIYLYHDHFREDEISARFKSLAAVWRNFVGLPDPVVERAIRADAPDILIDLAGHTGMTSRLPLYARRLAPVQINYLGYPNTTGLPAMDYRFTDALADPSGEADRFATEKLVRFSSTAWSYSAPVDAPEPAPAPCLKNGYVTFGSFNTLAKITDRVLSLWAQVLHTVPNSRLRLKGQGLGDPAVRAAYQSRFTRLGLPVDRIDFFERTAGTKEHLALYGEVDIALDTFPYHGTTTTCESLWMGVPVVSLAGDRHMSRVGASLLTAVGRSGWIASTPADYVRIATALAGDTAQLSFEHATLHAAMQSSPLLDHPGQAERFGAALRNCWAAWCARGIRAA
jgi:protein O-GlcNAc transferase